MAREFKGYTALNVYIVDTGTFYINKQVTNNEKRSNNSSINDISYYLYLFDFYCNSV